MICLRYVFVDWVQSCNDHPNILKLVDVFVGKFVAV